MDVDNDGGANRQTTSCCQSPCTPLLVALYSESGTPHTLDLLSSLTVHTTGGFSLRFLVRLTVEILLAFKEGVHPYVPCENHSWCSNFRDARLRKCMHWHKGVPLEVLKFEQPSDSPFYLGSTPSFLGCCNLKIVLMPLAIFFYSIRSLIFILR